MADTKVSEVMTRAVVTLQPSDTVHEAAKALVDNQVSGAPVVEDDIVIGVVSESDLIHSVMPPIPVDRGPSILDALLVIGRAKARGHKHGKVVSDVMSPVVVEISPDSSVWKAASIMEARGIKRLPVTDDDGHLVGIVSRADLVRSMARGDEQLRDDVLAAIRVLGNDTIEDLQVSVRDGVATITGTADRKSTHDLAIRLGARTPGVVEIIDRLGFENDDSHVQGYANPALDPRRNWNSENVVGSER